MNIRENRCNGTDMVNLVMNRHCRKFCCVSHYVFDWIKAGEGKGVGSSVGEESITDWMLHELSRSLPRLKYWKFTRHEEGEKTGADWEWWFVDKRNSGVGLRIQAKKLDKTGDNYQRLAYQNKHGSQMEKLISDARSSNCIPLYALYCAPVASEWTPCCWPFLPWENGVFLASALTLNHEFFTGRDRQAASQRKVSMAELLQHSEPMPCLVCCPSSHATSAKEVHRYIESHFPEVPVKDESKTESRGWHKEIPAYIRDLLRQGENEASNVRQEEPPEEIQGKANAILITQLGEEDEF